MWKQQQHLQWCWRWGEAQPATLAHCLLAGRKASAGRQALPSPMRSAVSPPVVSKVSLAGWSQLNRLRWNGSP